MTALDHCHNCLNLLLSATQVTNVAERGNAGDITTWASESQPGHGSTLALILSSLVALDQLRSLLLQLS